MAITKTTDIVTLIARRDALVEARQTGTTRVTYEGRTVEYRNLDELQKLIDELNAEIDTEVGATATVRTRRVRMGSTKGIV